MKITIINSKGHWLNGWSTTPKRLKYLTDSLERNNLEVDIHEVSELAELESILKVEDANNLIFPNAYHVNLSKNSKEFVWIGDIIDQYQRPFIGSGSQALQQLLQKDKCQEILKAHDILIPEFVVIHPSDIGKEKDILTESQLSFPLIVKPTTLSGSIGISQDSIVHNEKEAIVQIRMLLKTYQTNVIVEDFIANDDLTVCYLAGKGRSPKLLSTYYKVLAKPGATSIVGVEDHELEWGEKKMMVPVKDENILNQLKEIIPKVCKIFNVKDVTRVDGRLDKNGKFRIFDVNAYPGLNPYGSTQTAQCHVLFPNHDLLDSYDALVNTILLSACHRYKMSAPQSVQDHNLFTIEASASTKQKYENWTF